MDQLAKSFADLAEKYGPGVADAAKGAAVTEAYSQLVSSFFFFIATTVFFLIGRRIWKWAKSEKFDAEVGYAFGGLAFVAAAVAAGLGLWSWIDPWTWTAIYHPEIWIAKRAFRL